MKLSKFYFKIYLKNIIFIFILLSVGFFSFYNRETLIISILEFTVGSTYALFCTTAGLMILGAYISGKDYEIIDVLETNKYKAYLSNIITGIKIITLLLLIPGIMILLYSNILNINYYQIKEMLHFIIIWYVSNIFTLVLGATIGFFVKSLLRYIICIFLFLPLTSGLKPVNLLKYRLLNIFEDKITAPVNYGSPVIFNLFYALDKLFIVSIILFMLVVTYLKAKKKPYKNYIFVIFILVLVEFLIIQGSAKSRTVIFNSMDYVENAEKEINTSYSISNYNMNINLNNKFSNRCSIELVKEADKLEFYLSEIFKIEEILVNGKQVKYSRDKDLVSIEDLDIQDEDLILDIYYSGRVYIENGLGTNICYVSSRDISLMDNVFYWYPVIASKNESCNFNIVVNSKTKIYSNLPILNMKKKEGKFYVSTLKGYSKGVNIFSGNLVETKHGDINVIYPRGLDEERIVSFVEEELNSDIFSKLDISKLRQIIITPYDNIPIRVYGDTVMMPSRFI
ncbi:hypothetical protein [Tepidimicrobium xylanilyticum]|uniref:Uncharacterized protein n=1 Tax=Tepidimicrobium xylanilyticum TaxID=1123352 RepID=A0A1H3DDN4_9FIRM|nr:hypothetical protein [Tepidimicrobium xylanilyticum]SDX64535.1 hypothetical protein SAMN05660923_02652 [Tepidimicrobium xylanilyticum]